MKFYPATRLEFAIWPFVPDIDLILLVGQTLRTCVRSWAIRQFRRELSSMPDWLLDEIGIKRNDIYSLAVDIVDGGKASQRATDGPRAA